VKASEWPAEEKAMQRSIEAFAAMVDAFALQFSQPQAIDLAGIMANQTGPGAWRELATQNGRLLIIRITPLKAEGGLTDYGDAISAVRGVMARFQSQYPDVMFGLTGIEVVESDETAAVARDSTVASIIAAVLIAALLIATFHSIRTPLILMAALGVGIAWSFGWLTLTIGHLQLISVIFAVILLGLGVAFGIHLLTSLDRLRHSHEDGADGFAKALGQSLVRVGPGLLTGAVTTAAAFGTTLFTDFQGVAEMGFIAACGIMLCLIAMLSVFPAMLRIFKPGHRHIRPLEQRTLRVFDEKHVLFVTRHPRWVLAIAAFTTVASLVGVSQMRFDYNLLALLPPEMESVDWQQRVMRDGEQSVYFGASVAGSLEQARERAVAFNALDSVESVGGIGLLFPEDEQQKLAALSKAYEPLRALIAPILSDDVSAKPSFAAADSEMVAQARALLNQFNTMRFGLSLYVNRAPPSLEPSLQSLGTAIQRLLDTAAPLEPDQLASRAFLLQQGYSEWRLQVATQLEQMFDPSPIMPSDFPPGLITPYVSKAPGTGQTRYALEVYPVAPQRQSDLLSAGFLSRFIGDIRSVDPGITGVIVQIYESGRLIWIAYLQAGVYALVAVIAIVWFDFRSLRDALLCITPVAVGFAATFAIMWLLGMQINPANIMVLPLMFGIGVDAGVHIIHRYRMEPNVRPLGLAHGTGQGIIVTSLTTMIGFGSLTVASHRGIAGLGLVMTIGIGLTMLACWLVMPAFLELRQRRREMLVDQASPEPAASL